MSILFMENEKVFTLHTKASTYQMKVDQYGFLLHLYYGRRTEGCMDYLLHYADRGFSGNPYEAEKDRTYSLDVLPQELPSSGTGDYRSPAVIIKNGDGSYGCDFRYRGHRIVPGKYSLPGLPAVYAKEEEAQTLEIDLEDPVTKVAATLFYGILPELDIITRSLCITNGGKGKIYLEKIQTACLDWVWGEYDLITFYGRHAMERNFQRTPIAHGAQVIGSRRGTSSHQYNPMMIVAQRETWEDAGSCYAMSFVYSGSFKGEAEKDQFQQTRVQLGLSDELFSYPLSEGEVFFAPETVLTYSSQGLSRLSQNLHRCFRTHLCRGKYRDCVRPVLLNSWEAAYFDFNGEEIYQFAKEASKLGIEMLVLDDGWFGKRNDDFSGLGDWQVNEEKLGETLEHLIGRINGLGMKFGIWFEPEGINEDSELYRLHPDWVLTVPGRNPVRARYQLVLDFSRKDVVDYMFQEICKVLDQGNIEYVKWDVNRSICDWYSPTLTKKRQLELPHRYILGLYELLERLTKEFPDILFEGCCGGGGRFDAGMLYYCPQIWCSDDTDAHERTVIQYGTSFFYPVSTVGSHVSAVPNHQTGRVTSIRTRGTVAMAGSFGYELDLNKLDEEEKKEVSEQVKSYKKYQNLIYNGLYYRLCDPGESGMSFWEFVSEDSLEVLVQGVVYRAQPNALRRRLRLAGLSEEAKYRVTGEESIYSGKTLMAGGILLPEIKGDDMAVQIHLKRLSTL